MLDILRSMYKDINFISFEESLNYTKNILYIYLKKLKTYPQSLNSINSLIIYKMTLLYLY